MIERVQLEGAADLRELGNCPPGFQPPATPGLDPEELQPSEVVSDD
jgi:hypothetical protein